METATTWKGIPASYWEPPDDPPPSRCASCGVEYYSHYEAEGHDWRSGNCSWCDRVSGASACTMERVTFHNAAKDYPDSRIVKGERYARIVRGGYTIDGPRWLRVERRKAPSDHEFWAAFYSQLQPTRGSYSEPEYEGPDPDNFDEDRAIAKAEAAYERMVYGG